MRREGNKLTAAAVRAASKPGLYGDGHGLYLQVSAFETKAWIFRYMIDGRARKMGLGPLHTISLAEARKRAAEARLRVHDGIDPIDDEKAKRGRRKLDAAKAITFRQCAENYIEANRVGWKNAKHADQWSATFNQTEPGSLTFQPRQPRSTTCSFHDRYRFGPEGLGTALGEDARIGETNSGPH